MELDWVGPSRILDRTAIPRSSPHGPPSRAKFAVNRLGKTGNCRLSRPERVILLGGSNREQTAMMTNEELAALLQ
jgi:hypothetical protein